MQKLEPDVVTLDLQLPDADGLEILDQIMKKYPRPVVIVSGVSQSAAEKTLEALQLGAVDFVLKYEPRSAKSPAALKQEIVSKISMASKIRVIRTLSRNSLSTVPKPGPFNILHLPARPAVSLPGVLVIGASTGGPKALEELLVELAPDFPLPIVIVQHMPEAFTGALAAQLDRYASLQVKEAQAGDRLSVGCVFVAPGHSHLQVFGDGHIKLSRSEPIKGHRPSIDVTMTSAVESFGARTQGVLLTGMGEDGAAGLLKVRMVGGRTFAQEEESCVVYGMPKKAIESGAAVYVSTPSQIGKTLNQYPYPG